MLSEQELIRREKLDKLRKYGINPYPAALFKVSTNTIKIISDFKENKSVSIAGRLMSRRIQGKQALLKFKIVKEKFNYTLIGMKFVQMKTNQCIMMFIKNFLI